MGIGELGGVCEPNELGKLSGVVFKSCSEVVGALDRVGFGSGTAEAAGQLDDETIRQRDSGAEEHVEVDRKVVVKWDMEIVKH